MTHIEEWLNAALGKISEDFIKRHEDLWRKVRGEIATGDLTDETNDALQAAIRAFVLSQ